MKFYTQNGGKRPVRLSEKTRQFAYDPLNRKYGIDTLKTMSISLDDVDNFNELSVLKKYDLAIMRIAEKAPIRICEGEMLSGAATLGMAIHHCIPATYGEKSICSSISHLTVDFETVLKCGVNFIKKKAEASYKNYKGTEKEAFAKSCLKRRKSTQSSAVIQQRELPLLSDLPLFAPLLR